MRFHVQLHKEPHRVKGTSSDAGQSRVRHFQLLETSPMGLAALAACHPCHSTRGVPECMAANRCLAHRHENQSNEALADGAFRLWTYS